MLLSYEMAFEEGFDWVKGGKLPGLRGGLNSTGCSGGKLASGMDCFSARLMWRRNGNGESKGLFHVWLAGVNQVTLQSMLTSRKPMIYAAGRTCPATTTLELA